MPTADETKSDDEAHAGATGDVLGARQVALPAVLTLLIVVASLVPPSLVLGPPTPGGPTTLLGVALDKWVHAVAYAVLAGTLVPPLAEQHQSHWRVAVVAVTVATGVGLGVELLQWPHPGRTASLADAAANLVGAVCGAVVAVVRRSR